MIRKKNLKGLVIGCGSIGERHIYNLKKQEIKEVGIFDISKKKTLQLSKKYNVIPYNNIDNAFLSKPDFCFICTYPKSHLTLLSKCIENNIHVFVEKPISINSKGVVTLLKKADRKKLKISVGYNTRFDIGMQNVKKKLSQNIIDNPLSVMSYFGNNIRFWRNDNSFKHHYILKPGGGIILDDSHEYDFVRWLLDDEVKSVYSQTQKMKSIDTKTESVAAIILKFKKGTVASLVLDYVRPNYERKFQIIGDGGDITWNFKPLPSKKSLFSSHVNVSVTSTLIGKKSKMINFKPKINDMYEKEIGDFLNAIVYDKQPLVNGWEGLKTLIIGEAALKSAKNNCVIHL